MIDPSGEYVGRYGANPFQTLLELAAVDYALAEKSFIHFFKAAWGVLEPNAPLLLNWHHEAIAEYLEATLAGDINRLIINMPPRYSKSLLVTVMFPAWCWIKNPSLRFINASYSADLATKHGVDRRILMRSDWYQAAWADRFQFSDEQNQKTEYVNNHRGHMVSAGMLGTVTGKGGDCLPAGAMVTTKIGEIDIAQLVALPYIPDVLSFNHASNRWEWRRVIAVKETLASELVEIQTKSGRVIRCTADHRIFIVGQGYRPAGAIVSGHELISPPQRGQLPSMRSEKAGPRPDLPEMLSGPPRRASSYVELRLLRCKIRAAVLRGKQKGKERAYRRLLLDRLLAGAPCNEKSQAMRNLPLAGRKENEAILLGMPSKEFCQKAGFTAHKMPCLPGNFSARILAGAALLTQLRESGSLRPHGWSRQFALQKRPKLQHAIRQNERVGYISSRRRALRCMQNGFFQGKACRASYRRKRTKQRALQLNSFMPALPYEASQIEIDTVSLVRRIRAESEPVYDIQVETNCNFVAQGLLVHNCIIIDDPHNPKKAESEAERESAVAAFDSTFTTRLDNKKTGRIIVVMQRLHYKDLTGHLLKKSEEGEHWEHLNLPAEAPARTTVVFPVSGKKIIREKGDILHPEREGRAELEKVKVGLGSYNYAGQYEQNPSPRHGGIFKRSYWRYYSALPERFDEIIQSWDMSFKDLITADPVAGCVLGRIDEEIYVLDFINERLGFRASCNAVLSLTKRWPLARRKYLEDKANGPAVADALRAKIPGLILVNPQGSKIERAALVEPVFESGNVLLPHEHIAQPWVKNLIEQCAAFPRGAHDDMVDALTQGVNSLQAKGTERLKALGKL